MNELPTIDIHGMTRAEASKVIRPNLKYFHDQGFHEVHIIHGHGTGVLKAYVRALLNNLSYVKDMRSESNDGVTVAVF
jgi:DNA-nicking Smr family endonuclease